MRHETEWNIAAAAAPAAADGGGGGGGGSCSCSYTHFDRAVRVSEQLLGSASDRDGENNDSGRTLAHWTLLLLLPPPCFP